MGMYITLYNLLYNLLYNPPIIILKSDFSSFHLCDQLLFNKLTSTYLL